LCPVCQCKLNTLNAVFHFQLAHPGCNNLTAFVQSFGNTDTSFKEQVKRLKLELQRTKQELRLSRQKLAKQEAQNAKLTAMLNLARSSNDAIVQECDKVKEAMKIALEEA
jgi:hypothetical protein